MESPVTQRKSFFFLSFFFFLQFRPLRISVCGDKQLALRGIANLRQSNWCIERATARPDHSLCLNTRPTHQLLAHSHSQRFDTVRETLMMFSLLGSRYDTIRYIICTGKLTGKLPV